MAKCDHHKWTLQKDGMLSHTAWDTIAYLRHDNVTFIHQTCAPPTARLKAGGLRHLVGPAASEYTVIKQYAYFVCPW